MTRTFDDKPLWRVMLDAYCEHSRNDEDYLPQERLGMARELRAIADIIERRGILDPGETANWLRAEADRAESTTATYTP